MTKPTSLTKREPDIGRQIPIGPTRALPPIPRSIEHLPQPIGGPRNVRIYPRPVAKGGGYCCGVCGAPGSIGQTCRYCREVVR